MNDVRAVEQELNRLTHRQTDLIGQHYLIPYGWLIAHAPPPLLSADGDSETAFRRMRQHSLIAVGDPRLSRAINFVNM